MEKTKPVFTWQSNNHQNSCSIQTNVLFDKYPQTSRLYPPKYQISTVWIFVGWEKRQNKQKHCDQETGGMGIRNDRYIHLMKYIIDDRGNVTSYQTLKSTFDSMKTF